MKLPVKRLRRLEQAQGGSPIQIWVSGGAIQQFHYLERRVLLLNSRGHHQGGLETVSPQSEKQFLSHARESK